MKKLGFCLLTTFYWKITNSGTAIRFPICMFLAPCPKLIAIYSFNISSKIVPAQ